MVQIEVKNLTFTYPECSDAAIKSVSVDIEKGDFVLVCGPSGCGKTTLLRNLKKTLAPYGKKEGQVLFCGNKIENIEDRLDIEKIGYVFQQVQHQSVADTVESEMAFGMENLGWDHTKMALSIAETADYFGFSGKMGERVDKLSGGQQQLLNVAAVMTMQPEVLILDEPTAQLDPVAAENMLMIIHKINRDFGTTIIMSEHRLDNVMYMANKLMVMEKGSVVNYGSPCHTAWQIKNHGFYGAMPENIKLYFNYENSPQDCPKTVGETRRWLAKRDDVTLIRDEYTEASKKQRRPSERTSVNKEAVVQVKNVWFRYGREGKDILRGVSIDINKSEILGIVGANGCGKSTLLSVVGGLKKPYRGKVRGHGRAAMLVQDVQCLFRHDTVREELSDGNNLRNEDEKKVVEAMELGGLMEQNPYDLSGGEQQRLGIARLMMSGADVLMFDEPTKGMDNVYKKKLVRLLIRLRNMGKAVVIVSHDINFMAECADCCALMFDGHIVVRDDSDKFFKGSRYYTTDMEKIFNGF